MKENLQQSAAKLGLSHRFIFQHDSNPNDELYPIKNLCGELKTKVNAKKTSNLEELDRVTEEEWAGIDQEMSVRL